ncbi:MAG TPA: hypothetical protein VHP38_13070 [Ruminiclostridium sp.]|nr:hypothetical protein [Ruminiclostridium sp.]
MDHVVFLNKKFKGFDKIASGEKSAESRWASGKRSPYGKVGKGDRLFFKDTGNPVKLMAEVEDVMYFTKLESEEVENIIHKYNDRICMSEEEIKTAVQKKNGSIVFFDNVKEIKPFDIDKSNYSSMADWIVVEDISMISLDV